MVTLTRNHTIYALIMYSLVSHRLICFVTSCPHMLYSHGIQNNDWNENKSDLPHHLLLLLARLTHQGVFCFLHIYLMISFYHLIALIFTMFYINFIKTLIQNSILFTSIIHKALSCQKDYSLNCAFLYKNQLQYFSYYLIRN